MESRREQACHGAQQSTQPGEAVSASDAEMWAGTGPTGLFRHHVGLSPGLPRNRLSPGNLRSASAWQ